MVVTKDHDSAYLERNGKSLLWNAVIRQVQYDDDDDDNNKRRVLLPPQTPKRTEYVTRDLSIT